MGQLLEGLLLVTSSALPQALLAAFLSAGCAAVVCRDAAAPPPAAAAAAAFFAALYSCLRRGSTLPQVGNPRSPRPLSSALSLSLLLLSNCPIVGPIRL